MLSCDPFATGEVMTRSGTRQGLVEELSSRGIRLTAQRRAVVDVIQEATEHLDAGSLHELARKREPNIDRATVYRTIELLKKVGLIDELDLMHLEGEKHYYELRTSHQHAHLACFRCGRIEEFSSVLFDKLKTEIERQTGFSISVARLEAGGKCRACASGEAAPGREASKQGGETK
jgi:Fur family ferric uptake transcriptional regulator